MSFFTRQRSQNIRPLPDDPWDQARVEEQGRRREMMEGTWADTLEKFIVAHMGPRRRRLMGPKDLSSNFLRSVTGQLSTLFDVPPIVTHPLGTFPELLGQDVMTDAGQTEHVPGLLEKAGLWSMMPKVQQNTNALNEMLVQVLADPLPDGSFVPRFRPVWPDMVEAIEDPKNAGQAIVLRELRERRDPRPERAGKPVWAWDEYDISDPANPTFRIVAVNGSGTPGQIITPMVAPEWADRMVDGVLAGEAYPWRMLTRDRAPIIPIGWFHREWPTTLWDPFANREAVEITLVIGLLWSYWLHVVKTAAHATKYVAGGWIDPGDSSAEETGGIQRVLGDAASILRIFQDDNANTVLVGQWSPGIDPLTLGQAIAAYETRGGSAMGLQSSDVLRTSGDPRSGYALEISETAKQKMALKQAPVMAYGTEALLGLTGAVLNSAYGEVKYPEDGWFVQFPVAMTTGKKDSGDAFNGNQVKSATDIVTLVAKREIPRSSGVATLMRFFNFSQEEAEAVIGPAGDSFNPPTIQ